ncbi:hypothetical protein FJM65_02410 [Pontibacter mangrovi]|uniref:STAS/SEC14 domain-containing protein n=1 Tax=Pontibacter mangrovi TaxID=2589816 RepID=A0A501WCJ6_9BACT|nr:hypothetical protein FJM65_02410 [Pontibacter mangrovi]
MPGQHLRFKTIRQDEFFIMKFNQEEKFLWNTWKGKMPSAQLREAMLFASNFILAYNVTCILADYRLMHAPTLSDQAWIAKHTGKLLQHSKLERVANLLAPDVFQQKAIETIYEKASEMPQPCETRDFIEEQDAIKWLMDGDHTL